MEGLPARCTRCGRTFLVPNLIGGDVDVAVSHGNARCPSCGGLARIGDGRFAVRGRNVRPLAVPDLTQSMIDDLHRIAERARDTDITADEILAEIADVSPEFADRLREREPSRWVLILLLVWLLKSCSLNVTVDVNRLYDQAVSAAEGHDPEQHLDRLPPPPETPTPYSPGQPEFPPATMGDQPPGQPSRQVRRREQRLARKRYDRMRRT